MVHYCLQLAGWEKKWKMPIDVSRMTASYFWLLHICDLKPGLLINK